MSEHAWWTQYNYWTVLSLAVSFWLVFKAINTGRRSSKLPPGPATVPILGNLHLFPKNSLHLKLTEWSKVYGDIYSLKLGPGTVVVLTSPRAVRELLDKRSASSPDRSPHYMAELVTGGMNIAIARYDKHWKPLRRVTHEILNRNSCMTTFLPVQQAEATQLMHDLLSQPQEFYNDIKRYSTSVMTSVLFGTRCPDYNAPIMTEFHHALGLWQQVLELGAHPPVDLLPILKYVPERWAPWKTLCRKVRYLQRQLYFGLRDQCENRIREGKRNGCFLEEVIDNSKKYCLDREMIAFLGGSLIEGGAETTSLFLQSLVILLVAFPEVQKKAHEEIDRVIGRERVPTLDDFKDLPYVQAIVKETHRFRPVATLAFPHASMVEETIDGYVIPKGTAIFMNIWGILHDETVFDEPERFNPDRFLASEYGTKAHADQTAFRHDLVFGSGRRICAGIHLAQNSISINAMNFLWGFNFNEAIDHVTGEAIKVDINDYIRGLVTGPSPFSCNITVRSEGHAELIAEEMVHAKAAFLAYEQETLHVDMGNNVF
ncbi:cytochrome P450 [Ramaria rubella]|nr:cytochrome P450 [Ramaria rubella]